MCPHDSADSISLPQMNSDLQHAHLELLSAHCAVHQLRLRYSADDLIRFGRRDVLRKSAEAASALHQFYSSLENNVPQAEPATPPSHPTPEQVAQAVGWLSSYLHTEREHYLPASGELGADLKASMLPYFSAALLDKMRVVELQGARVEVPAFFAQARAFGFDPPEITHMDSLTFLDVLVFNQRVTERALFHGLVHAAQIQYLGLERYAELWIRSFIKTRTHFTVPLEVHAFSLASKFLRPSGEEFSVEESVLEWIGAGRYDVPLGHAAAAGFSVPPPR